MEVKYGRGLRYIIYRERQEWSVEDRRERKSERISRAATP
jgi:hypothetical protein